MAYWHTTCQPEVGQAFVCCCNSVFVYYVVSFCLSVFLFFGLSAFLFACRLASKSCPLTKPVKENLVIGRPFACFICVCVFRCHFFVIVSKFRTSVLALLEMNLCFLGLWLIFIQKDEIRQVIDEKLEEFAELLTEDWKNHQETGTVRIYKVLSPLFDRIHPTRTITSYFTQM